MTVHRLRAPHEDHGILAEPPLAEVGQLLAKGYLERLLKNPFYKGQFIWEDKLYNGTHAPLISAEVFEQVQSVFRGHNKPKYRSHDFAFSGLLRCAYDNCTVTAEIKKNRYTYYHCTGYRGKCELPYFREENLVTGSAPSYGTFTFPTMC